MRTTPPGHTRPSQRLAQLKPALLQQLGPYTNTAPCFDHHECGRIVQTAKDNVSTGTGRSTAGRSWQEDNEHSGPVNIGARTCGAAEQDGAGHPGCSSRLKYCASGRRLRLFRSQDSGRGSDGDAKCTDGNSDDIGGRWGALREPPPNSTGGWGVSCSEPEQHAKANNSGWGAPKAQRIDYRREGLCLTRKTETTTPINRAGGGGDIHLLVTFWLL